MDDLRSWHVGVWCWKAGKTVRDGGVCCVIIFSVEVSSLGQVVCRTRTTRWTEAVLADWTLQPYMYKYDVQQENSVHNLDEGQGKPSRKINMKIADGRRTMKNSLTKFNNIQLQSSTETGEAIKHDSKIYVFQTFSLSFLSTSLTLVNLFQSKWNYKRKI